MEQWITACVGLGLAVGGLVMVELWDAWMREDRVKVTLKQAKRGWVRGDAVELALDPYRELERQCNLWWYTLALDLRAFLCYNIVIKILVKVATDFGRGVLKGSRRACHEEGNN